MDEVMMVPINELKQLENYYKEQITESAMLKKAGQLAVEQHLILKDRSILDSIAVKMTKPLAHKQNRLVKCVRTGTTTLTVYQGTEEPEGSTAAGPVENLLKQLIKGLDQPNRKKEPITPKIKKEPKKSIRKRVSMPKSSKKGALRTVLVGAAAEAIKSLERPKKKRKKKTEVEKLRLSEGWESWYPQGDLRRRLEYDDD